MTETLLRAPVLLWNSASFRGRMTCIGKEGKHWWPGAEADLLWVLLCALISWGVRMGLQLHRCVGFRLYNYSLLSFVNFRLFYGTSVCMHVRQSSHRMLTCCACQSDGTLATANFVTVFPQIIFVLFESNQQLLGTCKLCYYLLFEYEHALRMKSTTLKHSHTL